jgi:hypothetical protein
LIVTLLLAASAMIQVAPFPQLQNAGDHDQRRRVAQSQTLKRFALAFACHEIFTALGGAERQFSGHMVHYP